MIYLHGNILSGSQARKWLTDAPVRDAKCIEICTAYLRVTALKSVYEQFLSSGYSGQTRILTRWKLQDLLSGASDLESYCYASEKGIPFYINTDFHGKVYRVDNVGILLGSANLTLSGFGFNKRTSNEECCTVFADTHENTDYIQRLFENSVLVTPQLFQRISEHVSGCEQGKIDRAEWSQEILDCMSTVHAVYELFVDELIFTESPSVVMNAMDLTADVTHDLSLLGVHEPTTDSLRKGFKESKAYSWLLTQLRECDGVAYFGDLTARLHSAILNDPTPYRKDVKKFLGNLLEWASLMMPDSIKVDRPNYSQRVQLLNRP